MHCCTIQYNTTIITTIQLLYCRTPCLEACYETYVLIYAFSRTLQRNEGTTVRRADCAANVTETWQSIPPFSFECVRSS